MGVYFIINEPELITESFVIIASKTGGALLRMSHQVYITRTYTFSVM